MKAFVILFIMITSTTLATTDNGEPRAESLAQEILASLRNQSSADFVKLFPSLSEFKRVMKENEVLYGKNLIHAERDFSNEYQRRILPVVEKRFAELSGPGMNWQQYSIERVTVTTDSDHSLVATIEITFRSGDIERKLIVDRAMLMDGKWHISQFIRLV